MEEALECSCQWGQQSDNVDVEKNCGQRCDFTKSGKAQIRLLCKKDRHCRVSTMTTSRDGVRITEEY